MITDLIFAPSNATGGEELGKKNAFSFGSLSQKSKLWQ